MHGLPSKDGETLIDWGKTSQDYAEHRPGPPASFFTRLSALGVGAPGQTILDLGTGTGVLARQFARQGAEAYGVDVSTEQIQSAERLAKEEGLTARFGVHPAESLPWSEPTFDAVTANQCWLYFDKEKVIEELRRVLKPGGVLVTSHFSWLPRKDEIARRSEALVREFNPNWSAADWSGEIPPFPAWATPYFHLVGMFWYDEPIRFTRESWAGRIRACRGIGATLPEGEVAKFDLAHQDMLRHTAPESFTVLHRLDAHFFVFKAEE